MIYSDYLSDQIDFSTRFTLDGNRTLVPVPRNESKSTLNYPILHISKLIYILTVTKNYIVVRRWFSGEMVTIYYHQCGAIFC